MRAFGYVRGDDDAEAPTELQEVTLLCSVDDLHRLRAFIEKVITERSADDSLDKGPWHDHFRDRDGRWTEDEADVILYVDK
jgi:hypothetical protein